MKEQNQDNTDTKWMGAGLFAAFVASLCCVTPVLAFLAGIGGVASTFSWIEPFRPYLIGLTALLLGFAWYQKLKPQWDPECACEEDPSFWNTKGFLGIVTILAALLLAFPYYSDAFFPKQDKQVVYVQESQVQTITWDIKGMTCTGCEATVENAASGVDGVLEAAASYDAGKATIKYDQSKTNQETIKAAINKTGFTVAEKQAN
ncbi:mercuric transport protein MerTP [Aliifodinibius sp. S!AR15-10]|uniref:mercuric transport protein MerTP n=1 Tax=Aliifodinibius sp. S!AR15-10 TaxID=2950437 RepID=UPI0028645828|nr:mercuric transport protein MerTP [Aliifodinibius sp. S!AR15-10]MDR8390496.1 mercuric transport protein MerTP [Aliifodinibius sp. S!AR15-10]